MVKSRGEEGDHRIWVKSCRNPLHKDVQNTGHYHTLSIKRCTHGSLSGCKKCEAGV